MAKHRDLRGKTGADLIQAIVEAACEQRDLDWDKGDPIPVIEKLDNAIDDWREYLRRQRTWEAKD